MSNDNMTESQRNQLAAELTGPGAFERHTAATIERLSGLVVELVRERSRVTVVRPPKIEVRDMKAELSAEPASYAAEFDAAEDMAKLRRERCALQKRAERAEEALGAADAVIASVTGALAGEPQKPGYLGEHVAELMRERDEAWVDLANLTEHATSQEAATDKLASTIDAVWGALGNNPPPGLIDEAVAAQRRELLELRRRRDELVKEQEEVRNVIDWSGPLPRGGMPEAVGRIVSNRDNLLAQIEAAEKKAQAFPGAEISELRAKVEAQIVELEKRRNALSLCEAKEAGAALRIARLEDEVRGLEGCRTRANTQEAELLAKKAEVDRLRAEAEAAQEELTHLKTERDALVELLGKAQDRISGFEHWRDSVSEVLDCGPDNIMDALQDILRGKKGYQS